MVIGAFSVRRLESVIVTVGNMAAGRQGTGAVAESLHFDPTSRSAHIVPSVARLSLSVLRKPELVPVVASLMSYK